MHDRSWGRGHDVTTDAPATQLCHVTAHEVGGEHRARVYDAHGMVERLSIAEHGPQDSIFAVNFYATNINARSATRRSPCSARRPPRCSS